MIIIREKKLSSIWIILGGLVATILLIFILLSNSGFFSKNHTYKEGEIVTLHNVDFKYKGSITLDDKNGNHILEELTRKDFKNTLEYNGNTYEYFETYYNDFTDYIYLDRYRKVEEDTVESQWGNSYKNMFLNVEADFDGTVIRIAD
ncbi:hypothetical protein HMPREF9421_0705 [Streptococcus australis ATCC 700641]|jgi:hypothetical protein|uniref:Uncharacterized protein n=2 Tax=Streptococcus TaxID=1301 RepID=E7S9E9_9STRE|nr:hypothetical protein HMPREF9421_0705 [Streptococcus australis ATCC 700641]